LSIQLKQIIPKVFNFRRHWGKKVKPHLSDKDVQEALNYGMEDLMWNWRHDADLLDDEKFNALDDNRKSRFTWTPGTPSYYKTSSDYWLYHRTPLEHSVGWYQCMHCCHWIVYFCMALGLKIYPKLDWYIVSGRRHSVAVGFKYGKLYMVFDILNFEHMSAQHILDFADRKMTKKEYEKKWEIKRKRNRKNKVA